MKRKFLTFCLSTLMTICLVGCARKPSNPAIDPYENFNRVIFAFNQDIDHLIYRPVAKVYHTIIPPPLQTGITNIFDNIGELNVMSNDILQGKFKYVFLDLWRLILNSTIGVGGLFDVASKLGLKPHYNDFGMTLAYWSGKVKSPYFQIPFLGPSTFRDTLGLGADYVMSPYPYLRPEGWNYYSQAVRFVSIRANLLQTDKLVDDAFDPYIFVRNAYLQHREAAIRANNQSQSVEDSSRPSRFREHAPLPEPPAPSYQSDENAKPIA